MDINIIKQRLKAYTPVEISVDLKSFPEDQKQIIEYLISAGKIADQIFWKQSSHDALKTREQYKDSDGPIRDYIEINYGPYDRLNNYERFVGDGPAVKPLGAGFYPEMMTQAEFMEHIKKNPADKDLYEHLYTVISGKDDLKALFYHEIYDQEVKQIAHYLERAALLTKNDSLRSYFQKRAQAVKTDNYYDSEIAWMELEDNLIDTVIGPVENYEDRLFNYKTAYEAAVMIKDVPASKELAIYKKHLNNLEQNLPVEDKYKNDVEESGNRLEIVNIVYFGGDYQAGVKTIAASLPNDEKVISEKGAKKQLYKNIMEAKFDKILVPISNVLIHDSQKSFLSKHRFVSQVLLHEISHTIGPNYVVGKSLTVRKSLRDLYSVIEECKADILGIYATDYIGKIMSLKDDEIAEHYVTYTAGLFRSIRFGIEEAHGMANLIQLNFLTQHKVISFDHQTNQYLVDMNLFPKVVKELAKLLLMIEAHGNYEEAMRFIETYGKISTQTSESVDRLVSIPTDLDLNFTPDL